MHRNEEPTFFGIINDLAGHLREQQRSGVETLSPGEAQEIAGLLDRLIAEAPAAGSHPVPMKAGTLEQVREDLGDCRRCKLCQTRTHIVFGQGAPQAALMFVGEAPGRDEDLAGEPFVGEAGQLLTRIINAIALQRREVYIANVIKCRPPKNRDPEPDEIQSCLPFLERQIEVVRPKVICALGRVAAQTLLKSKEMISRMRGKVFTLGAIKVVPTYHPASLLRNPQWKRAVWEDVQLVQRLLAGDS